MKADVVGGAAASAAAPVVWNFLGYHFEAGPFIVAVCACLITRLIVSLGGHSRRLLLDVSITMLSVLVSALWVQANSLGLLPAGISGIAFGAIGIGIIGIAKGRAGAAFRAAFDTFFGNMAATHPGVPKVLDDQDQDLIDRIG